MNVKGAAHESLESVVVSVKVERARQRHHGIMIRESEPVRVSTQRMVYVSCINVPMHRGHALAHHWCQIEYVVQLSIRLQVDVTTHASTRQQVVTPSRDGEGLSIASNLRPQR